MWISSFVLSVLPWRTLLHQVEKWLTCDFMSLVSCKLSFSWSMIDEFYDWIYLLNAHVRNKSDCLFDRVLSLSLLRLSSPLNIIALGSPRGSLLYHLRWLFVLITLSSAIGQQIGLGHFRNNYSNHTFMTEPGIHLAPNNLSQLEKWSKCDVMLCPCLASLCYFH